MRRASPVTIATALAATLGVVSLLHLLRPIDIAFDSICYLLQAQRIMGLDAPTGWSRETVCPYPPGYPAMLALFLRLGVAMSAASVLLNLGCIVAALVALQKAAALVLNMPASWSIWPLLATANSFVIVRAVTPLHSEPLFLLLEALSLLCLARIARRVGRRPIDLVLAIVAIIFAMQTRTVGVALFAPLCWLGWQEIRGMPPHIRRRIAVLMAISVVVGATGTLYFRDYYLNADLGVNYKRGEVLVALLTSLGHHFREIGEIVLNAPLSKLPDRFRFPIIAAGAISSIGMLVLLWIRRRRWTVFEPYLIAYAAIIFIWPFYDARFWLPVIPIVALIVVDEIRVRGALEARRFRVALTAYGLYVLATGTIAHALNIRRSMNPNWLVQQYSSEPEDQSILAGLGQSTSPKVDSSVVRMLRSIRP